MANIKELSPQTRNLISLITDPYHDTNIAAVPYPDSSSLYSYMRTKRGRLSITNPFSATWATGDSWQAHIFTTPLLGISDMMAGESDTFSFTYAGEGTNTKLGPINVHYMHIRGGVRIANVFTPLGTVAEQAPQRTVSFGFEVHNTTSPLNRQGSVSVYRINYRPYNCDIKVVMSPTEGDPSVHYNNICSIPYDLATMNLIPNSRTWEAAEGAYVVSLPYHNNTFSSGVTSNALIKAGLDYKSTYATILAPYSDANVTHWSPLATGGSWFYGLSETTTLVLDYRHVIEVAPDVYQPSNLELATTVSEYNPHFLKLYKRVSLLLPPGTIVRNNDLGKWFKQIVSVVNDVLPSIVHILPPQYQPAAQIGQKMVSTVNALVNKTNNLTSEIKSVKAAKQSKQNNNNARVSPIPAPQRRSVMASTNARIRKIMEKQNTLRGRNTTRL
jgi:hypothetical protein